MCVSTERVNDQTNIKRTTLSPSKRNEEYKFQGDFLITLMAFSVQIYVSIFSISETSLTKSSNPNFSSGSHCFLQKKEEKDRT